MASSTAPPPISTPDNPPSQENTEEAQTPKDSATCELRSAKEEEQEKDPIMAAHITSLRLLFTAWLSHFRSLGYIKESTMDMLDKSVLRKILQLSVKDPKAREAIGTSPLVWSDILSLLRVAIPSLESRSYATIPDPYDTSATPTATVYDGPSSNVIVSNHPSLLRDLQRMNNTLCIARNVLTVGSPAQNLAAQLAIDREVCCLVNLCVKITARGYDGDGVGTDEEKWQAVVNEFKKLLITCLQFLSNLVTLNERLKLMLWVELFDSASEGNVPGWPDPAGAVRPPLHMSNKEAEDEWLTSAAGQLAMGSQQFMRSSKKAMEENTTMDEADVAADMAIAGLAPPFTPPRSPSRTPVRKSSTGNRIPSRSPTPPAVRIKRNMDIIAQEMRLQTGIEPTVQEVDAHATALIEQWPQDKLDELKARAQKELRRRDLKAMVPTDTENEYAKDDRLSSVLGEMAEAADVADGKTDGKMIAEDNAFAASNLFSPPSPSDPLYRFMESAQDGIRKLEEGKRELLKRLDTQPPVLPQDSHAVSPASPVESPASPLVEQASEDHPEFDPEDRDLEGEDDADLESEEEEDDDDEEEEEEEEDEGEEEEEDESSEDDYDRIPGEDGRGLLTDVPLILGPNEIEVLPMIIMSGIVTDAGQLKLKKEDSDEQLQVFLNMYTIRCHLLLAQENGRNLLRELLIFVAAWDLREEELYFKFMVKIMESILMHGLMPFAYSAFKESKDIISPAQAVIMKLLTKIFHSRQAFIRTPENENFLPKPQNGITDDPTRTVVSTLFSEFRSNIIPQICALIFLQGQIRAGRASIEDFPLNLWDMERMYEGVYQYLEFFAILTDHEEWKVLMAEWEVVSELVTLLRELEAGIGKRTLVRSVSLSGQQQQQPQSSGLSKAPSQQEPQSSSRQVDEQLPSQKLPPPVAVERPYSPMPATPIQPPSNLTIPPIVSPHPPTATSPISAVPSATASASPPLHEEPADFEWRNLKKLCVLVLSSLVWKNRTLQDQVLKFGGIETVLRCCAHDEHNPYIREHAIMCLRFCVEGNEEVRDVLRGIVNRGTPQAAAGAQETDGGTATGTTTMERKDGIDVGVEATQQPPEIIEPEGSLQEETEPLVVPPEVLDAHGYETFMDSKGQVGLRRKDAPRRVPRNAAGGPPSNAEWDGVREIYGGDVGTMSATSSISPSSSQEDNHGANGFPDDATAIPASLRPGNGNLSPGEHTLSSPPIAKPRTAADLQQWVEAITRDLPHRRAEREARMQMNMGAAVAESREGRNKR